MRGKRSEMRLFIELLIEFVFVRGIRLNAVLLLTRLTSWWSDELVILQVSCLNSIKLLWLERIPLNISLLIVSIQKLLVNLRLILNSII